MFNILVVDDDKNTRLLLRAVLEDEGYAVFTAENGADALSVLDREYIDLCVLDVMMPKMDGYAFTRELRQNNNELPILMVSAKQLPQDKRQGFLVGTDDYMTKPFSSDELLWRIAALLRRANIAQSKKIVIGRVTVDSDHYAVYTDDKFIEFPRKEFELLFKLLSYPDRIFSKEQLLDSVWGIASESGEETVKTHMSRIRSRLTGITEFRITTIKGLGYRAEITKEQA